MRAWQERIQSLIVERSHLLENLLKDPLWPVQAAREHIHRPNRRRGQFSDIKVHLHTMRVKLFSRHNDATQLGEEPQGRRTGESYFTYVQGIFPPNCRCYGHSIRPCQVGPTWCDSRVGSWIRNSILLAMRNEDCASELPLRAGFVYETTNATTKSTESETSSGF